MQRLKSPVTWLSATGTLGALYGLYEFQKQRQMTAQYATGKPDLGGSFSLVDADGKKVTSESLSPSESVYCDDVVGVWSRGPRRLRLGRIPAVPDLDQKG